MTDNRLCTCHPDDNPPQPCAERYALADCRTAAIKRAPFPYGKYGSMEIMESAAGNGHYSVSMYVKHITAEQAREAAHLLNQLAEYLESC